MLLNSASNITSYVHALKKMPIIPKILPLILSNNIIQQFIAALGH